MPRIGTLQSIWRYPVKSLAAVSLYEVQIDDDGIPRDRAQALIVRDGHARAGKAYRGKEHNLLHTTAEIERARSFAAAKGVMVEAKSEQPHYFDCAPISLIFDRWLDEASALAGYGLEALRFRPNLFARAEGDVHRDEASLTGATLQIGSTRLRVREPIERCVTPTYDLRTGESDPNVLRTITDRRAACLGIYCDVTRPGSLAIGDSIDLQ